MEIPKDGLEMNVRGPLPAIHKDNLLPSCLFEEVAGLIVVVIVMLII